MRGTGRAHLPAPSADDLGVIRLIVVADPHNLRDLQLLVAGVRALYVDEDAAEVLRVLDLDVVHGRHVELLRLWAAMAIGA